MGLEGGSAARAEPAVEATLGDGGGGLSALLFILGVAAAAFSLAEFTGHAAAGVLVVAAGLLVAAWAARREER